MNSLPGLRLADLVTLLAVQRTGSISSAARELRVTPSQVSKATVRLEKHFGVRLLSRGARGVAPTAAGRQLLPRIAKAVEELRATGRFRERQGLALELTLAGPSYLVTHVAPAVAGLLPGTRVRSVELAPAYLRACIAENVFDIALIPGGIRNPPAAWTSQRVGSLRFALVARPEFAVRLGPLPLTVDRARALPFVGPTRTATDRMMTASDDCPVPAEERTIVHEAQTVSAALEFALRGDFVVFAPLVAARRLLDCGALVELPVLGWDVRESLDVVCNRDRVLARVQSAVVQGVEQVLEGGDGSVTRTSEPLSAAGLVGTNYRASKPVTSVAH